MKTLIAFLWLLSGTASGQLTWLVNAPQPTLAPKDCKCVDCKCDPCDCHAKAKPAVSVKKVHTPAEASVIVRATKGKEVYQCSGTAIDEHTVLSCWHILREGGTLTVNNLPAKVLRSDSKADVALLTTDAALKPVKVADAPLKAGEPCTAYGYEWNRKGLFKFPTRITAVNRYSGFANVSIVGRPASGRSGGGLFNERGQLVGVCSAADGSEGLYAGHAAVVAIVSPKPASGTSVKPPVITPDTMPNFGVQSNKNCPSGNCPLLKKLAPAKSLPAERVNPASVSPGSQRDYYTPRQWGRR
jgi:hypothetical protein